MQAAASSAGIQTLLEAEKEAAKIVQKARQCAFSRVEVTARNTNEDWEDEMCFCLGFLSGSVRAAAKENSFDFFCRATPS